MSVARAHKIRTLAARQSTTAAASPAGAPGTMADKMLAMMAVHRAALKGIQSRTAKIEAKRGMMADYAAYIDGILAADAGGQNDVVVTVMLWRLDVGDFDGALEIAAYALRHTLTMPDGFARTVPTTVVEEIADTVLAALNPVEAMAEPLSCALDLTTDNDMPDEVRAKAHKAMGLLLKADAPEQAAEHFEIAITLDPKIGVKTELSRLKKALDAKAET